MFRMKQDKFTPPVIDLDGPMGNAFSLLGYAKEMLRTLSDEGVYSYINERGFSEGYPEWTDLEDELTADGYLHLLKTFNKYFGCYIVLETQNELLLADLEQENE